MVDRDLHIRIDIELRQPGPNRHWRHELEFEVPPDYAEADLLPYVRNMLENAVTELEEDELGGSRAAAIITAYDLRARAIEYLIRIAPHPMRGSMTAQLIREVIEADNDTIIADWRNRLGIEED